MTKEPKSQFATDREAFYARLEDKSAKLQDACYQAKLQVEGAISRLHRAVAALELAGAGSASALIQLADENTTEAKRILEPHAR